MDVPRGKRPTAGDRLGNIARSGAGLGMFGASRMAKPIRPRSNGNIVAAGQLVVVEHGDDDSVARPNAAIVLWVGAAVPSNAVDYDFRYPVTI